MFIDNLLYELALKLKLTIVNLKLTVGYTNKLALTMRLQR